MYNRRMRTDLNSLIAELLVVAHRLTRVAAQTTGSTTPSAVWHTLSILSTDGPLRIGDLAKIARVSQPSMTKVVQQLSEQEFVSRITDSRDSRAWLIAVAPKGVSALEDWRAQLGGVLGPVFADLGSADIAVLEQAVRLLRERTSDVTTQRVA
jgi:DNA-binding MarR family transcriptional regulator